MLFRPPLLYHFTVVMLVVAGNGTEAITIIQQGLTEYCGIIYEVRVTVIMPTVVYRSNRSRQGFFLSVTLFHYTN